MSDWNQYPRSVRQIGTPEHSCRVYLEDYADAYIRRIQADGPQGVHAGALYGRKIIQDGLLCYYIFGAVETEPVWEEGRLRFGQRAWRRIEQMQRSYFPTMEVCGWFVRAEEDFMPEQEQLQKVQDTFFSETGELLFTMSGEEGAFFRKGQSLLYPLQGYYVFYQSNTAMQEYMTGMAQGRRDGPRLRAVSPEEGRKLSAAAEMPVKKEETPYIQNIPEEPLRADGERMRPARAAVEEPPRADGERIRPARAAAEEPPRRNSGTSSAQTKPAEGEREAAAPGGNTWQRRFVAAALFVLLAGGIIFYGKPERAKAFQQMIAQRIFGSGEAVPAAGEAEGVSASAAEEADGVSASVPEEAEGVSASVAEEAEGMSAPEESSSETEANTEGADAGTAGEPASAE